MNQAVKITQSEYPRLSVNPMTTFRVKKCFTSDSIVINFKVLKNRSLVKEEHKMTDPYFDIRKRLKTNHLLWTSQDYNDARALKSGVFDGIIIFGVKEKTKDLTIQIHNSGKITIHCSGDFDSRINIEREYLDNWLTLMDDNQHGIETPSFQKLAGPVFVNPKKSFLNRFFVFDKENVQILSGTKFHSGGPYMRLEREVIEELRDVYDTYMSELKKLAHTVDIDNSLM